MASRKFNQVIVDRELAGFHDYAGPPCKAKDEHVEEDGTTTRDTIRRTCKRCESAKQGAWATRRAARDASTLPAV